MEKNEQEISTGTTLEEIDKTSRYYEALVKIFEPMCRDVYKQIDFLLNSQESLNERLKSVSKELDELDNIHEQLSPFVTSFQARLEKANSNINTQISDLNYIQKKIAHLEDNVSKLYIKKNIQLSKVE